MTAIPDPAVADPAIARAHDAAVTAGEAGYLDPTSALFVLTAVYLAERGSCCSQGCRHCPYTKDLLGLPIREPFSAPD